MRVLKNIFRRSRINPISAERDKETTTESITPNTSSIDIASIDTNNRMDALDLLDDIIEFLIDNARTSRTFATILDSTDSHSEIPTLYPPAALSALSKFTFARIYPFDKECHKDSKTKCNICLDRLIDGVAVSRLPCGHSYHINCIVPWLGRSCACPECRYEVETHDPIFEIGRRQRMRDRVTVTCKCSKNTHQCFFSENGIISNNILCHSTANVKTPRAA